MLEYFDDVQAVVLRRAATKTTKDEAELDGNSEPMVSNNIVLPIDTRPIGSPVKYSVAPEKVARICKAIELDPEYQWAFVNRGYSKNELNDFKGAIEDFNKAI